MCVFMYGDIYKRANTKALSTDTHRPIISLKTAEQKSTYWFTKMFYLNVTLEHKVDKMQDNTAWCLSEREREKKVPPAGKVQTGAIPAESDIYPLLLLREIKWL